MSRITFVVAVGSCAEARVDLNGGLVKHMDCHTRAERHDLVRAWQGHGGGA